MQETQKPRESRRHRRYPVCMMAALRRDDWGEERFLGDSDVFNISVKGCQIFSEMKLEAERFVGLRLRLPSQDIPVRVDLASIRWRNGETCGLEFIVVGNKDQERLNKFIETLQNAFV